MKIYTGQTSGEDLEKIKGLGMGIMISSSPHGSPGKAYGQVSCALDNGAFTCFKKGYPFQSNIFISTLQKCYSLGIPLDFITVPDMVGRGGESLEFSLSWVKEPRSLLYSAPNLALVLQDGMTQGDLKEEVLCLFTYLFIGGTVEWKWKTVDTWVKFAKDNGKKIHIGQCGKRSYLERARELGVDSVDSTSFQRNKSFDIVEQFLSQDKLF